MVDLFDYNFIKSIRNEEFFFFKNAVDINYSWNDFLRLYKNQPKQNLIFNDEAKRFSLTALHTRSSIPQFAKDVYGDIKHICDMNTISLIAFGGIDDQHKSFKVHRDGMDVFYVQVLGSVDWAIWENYVDEEAFLPEDQNGREIWKTRMEPGDAIWIPRGTFHHVDPLGSRVGFSFGVEGLPNPSTYI